MAIYFLECEQTKLIKIGFAVDVLKRMRLLQTGTPSKLRALRVLGGSRADEARIHQMFAAERMAGEWFRLETDAVFRPFGLPDCPVPEFKRGKSGRPANPNAPTSTERNRAYRERKGLVNVPVDPISRAHIATLRTRDGDPSDRAAVARALREAVGQGKGQGNE